MYYTDSLSYLLLIYLFISFNLIQKTVVVISLPRDNYVTFLVWIALPLNLEKNIAPLFGP